MSSFDMLCEVLERMDAKTYYDLMAEKTDAILPALIGLNDRGIDGTGVYMDFLLCAVAADGVLTEEEYILVKPIFDTIMEADTTFEDAQRFFHDNGLDVAHGYMDVMDEIVDLLGMLSPELKDDVVMLCLMVCAVDGEVSEAERDWIRKLIE